MWCDHPNDICHFSRTRIELTISHLIVIITSVHFFETKAIAIDKILDYFHRDDQSIWSSVTPKFQQCITIKIYRL